MRVALVHDFLTEYGGAERVLEAFHEIYPKAPVYVAFYDKKSLGVNADKFKDWKIITSWGKRLPFWRKLISPYRIFCKKFFESFDLSEFDLVISSSNAYMAKAVRVPNGVHICYCHTPPRFLYGYPTPINWKKNPFLRPIGEVINHFMRVWDFEVSQQPDRAHPRGVLRRDIAHPGGEGRIDYFIANSKEVQARIKKFYRRDSEVIYPPVDVEKFQKTQKTRRIRISDISDNQIIRNTEYSEFSGAYFLVVSRLVASKNVDIAVEVCAKLGLPLKVVGSGKELERLKSISFQYSSSERSESRSSRQARTINGSVDFIGEVDDSELVELYKNCRAVIFPASQEDFGLVPVEAAAAGKPVIANAQGGVLETVIDGKTGVYFDPPTTGSLTLAINNFVALEKREYFDAKFIKKHAEKFSKDRFKKKIQEFVREKTRR